MLIKRREIAALQMRIAYITAGAAGMYCGSCLRDNALARVLLARGHDILLVPTYTPTKTDEPNVSLSQVFLGGINVYLQHKSAIFRRVPQFLGRILDSPQLLKRAANWGVETDGADLGGMTVSMLRGEDGPNQREFARLATWLADSVQPQLVNLSNSLLIAAAAAIRRRINVPIVCSLTGEDLFVEELSDPWRSESLTLLRQRVSDVDAFITFSRDYAAFMQDYLKIPDSKLFVVPIGISLDGHGAEVAAADSAVQTQTGGTDHPPSDAHKRGNTSKESDGPVIGYFARICPEKGLHILCEAFRLLRQREQFAGCRLRIAGYLRERDRQFWKELQRQIAEWGLRDSVDFLGELDRLAKIRFLQSLDVFSVPSVCRESKGMSVLEAWANRLPVVQPWHSIYAELVNATQGGVLVPPNDPTALADGIAQLLDNRDLRQELGRRGREGVERLFTADRMADATLVIYQQCVASNFQPQSH
jgi:glycosyltransferase involved in cell wall biosynthesis